MSKPLSNSQIAKLGDRLRDGIHTAEDLFLLSEYRAGFAAASAEVATTIRALLPPEQTLLIEPYYNPTERAAKSNKSIIDKLRRLKTSQLSQMQDVAGCRVVVAHLLEQDNLKEKLSTAFAKHRTYDLRRHPHSGYRAVHVVVHAQERRVEVQIRTQLQDLWAQCSESWAFSVDLAIKYGGGPVKIQERLLRLSEVVWLHEKQGFPLLRNFALGDLTSLFHLEGAELEVVAQWITERDESVRTLISQYRQWAEGYKQGEGS